MHTQHRYSEAVQKPAHPPFRIEYTQKKKIVIACQQLLCLALALSHPVQSLSFQLHRSMHILSNAICH